MIRVELENPNDWWDVVYSLRVLADRTLLQERVGDAPEGAADDLDRIADEIDRQYRKQVLEQEAQ